MTDSPLYISFLWHMHQPFYKDPDSEFYKLPWVRLHGTKDYLDMVDRLREFPNIKQTFNFTPSLLEQLTGYTKQNARDSHLELTLKKASDLSMDERVFILENFFLAHWEHMIRPFPRYYELLSKRGMYIIKSDLIRTARYFNDRDFLDLQVLFNLCWIDPLFRQKDPVLLALSEKGREYSEEDKRQLIEKQFSILNEIIPRYREAATSGQIELSVSPFYHPILPLLCDTNSAKAAMPDVTLPKKRFAHPEDAEKQIRMGIEYFEKHFGYRPPGMWPSEGSVSEEVAGLASKAGIRWIGTDEDILSLSLGKKLRDDTGRVIDPSVLYTPYRFADVSIIFRDHSLSDLIGFEYSRWDAKSAAADLINRFLQIRSSLPGQRPHLVSIILDGENAWEYYRNDGNDFLDYLYEGLSKEQRLKTVTVSGYLNEHDSGRQLHRLHAGSWISANYAVWIGHEEDNRAWDYLTEAREELEAFQRMHPDIDLPDAWKSLYIAEGSDWNWWYGDEHITANQQEFDELFRTNLMKIYKEMGKEIPDHLFIPVLREDRKIVPSIPVRGFINPKIDGMVTSYYEWYEAARMDIKKSGGSMHKSESLLSHLYYGFDKDNLFLRFDPAIPLNTLPDNILFLIYLRKPAEMRIVIAIRPLLTAELQVKRNDEWEKVKAIADIAVQDIIEVKIPFSDLNAVQNDEVNLSVSVTRGGDEIERCPWRGYLSLTAPTPDFEATMWR